jgi:hypothetical protein
MCHRPLLCLDFPLLLLPHILSHMKQPLPRCYSQIIQSCFEMSSYLTENTICHLLVLHLQLFVLCCLVPHKVQPVSILKAITQMHIRVSSSKVPDVFALIVKKN